MKVPDSITQWVFHGLALSKEGFGVAKTTRVTAFKSMFVECHLPFSVRRQEQVSLACTAYNYGIDDADVSSHSASKLVSKFGLYICATFSQAIIRMVDTPRNVCTTAGMGKLTRPIRLKIQSHGTATVLFPMVPLAVGKTKLSVRLLTLGFNVADEIVKEIRVDVSPKDLFPEFCSADAFILV